MSIQTSNSGGGVGALSETTISALFDSRAEADRAIERLRAGGVPADSIRLTEGSEGTPADEPQAADRGFFDALGDFFFPPDDRGVYAEGLARGGFLVTVSGLVGEGYLAALDILDDEGAVNIDEREAAWRAEGWDRNQGLGWSGEPSRETARQGSAAASEFAEAPAAPFARDSVDEADAAATAGNSARGNETIPIVEERVRIDKRDTSHGRVRVRSFVRETPFSEDVELTRERVDIERHPVDRVVTDNDDAFRDRSIEVEERAEVAVVTKEARVVEEIALRRASETHVETVTDTERRTEVEIEDDRDAAAARDRSPV